jgi:hypothetical protein
VSIQRIHATFFAGGLTILIGSAILYTQYGFWHDTYVRKEVIEEQTVKQIETPFQTLTRLLSEGKDRFSRVTETLTPVVTTDVVFDRNSTTSTP